MPAPSCGCSSSVASRASSLWWAQRVDGVFRGSASTASSGAAFCRERAGELSARSRSDASSAAQSRRLAAGAPGAGGFTGIDTSGKYLMPR